MSLSGEHFETSYQGGDFLKINFFARVQTAVKSIKKHSSDFPKIGIILGSGLNEFVDAIDGKAIPFSRIKGFPVSGTEGHKGILKIGKDQLIFAGRFHFYEGLDMDSVVLPVFVMHALGAKTLIVTNAAGGINPKLSPGDLVCIRDHINLMGQNPLRGPNNDKAGLRFPDMKTAYSAALRAIAMDQVVCELKEGVYAAVQGPAYETCAEARMLQVMGADMVGMSTVPEVIAARYLKMEVLGISCISNRVGIAEAPVSHEEVMETGKKVSEKFTGLLKHVLAKID
jgi:purine-nucleoside phosphorylase